MSIAEVRIARTMSDAWDMAAAGLYPLAGGTDLIPRIKHGLLADARLVSVRNIPELRGLGAGGGRLVVGASVPLAELSRSPACPPWLRDACREVASPRVRELATIGGAVLQAPRCRYLNRPAHWRTAAGACLRTGGTRCLAGGDRCHAQHRSLLSTLLVAVGASIRVSRRAGEEDLSLEDVLSREGCGGEPGGIVRAVSIPERTGGAVAVEWIRRRGSIDFHDLVIAAASIDDTREIHVAAGCALPYPRRLVLSSTSPEETIQEVAALIPPVQPGRFDAEYLRHAAVVLTRRAFARVVP